MLMGPDCKPAGKPVAGNRNDDAHMNFLEWRHAQSAALPQMEVAQIGDWGTSVQIKNDPKPEDFPLWSDEQVATLRKARQRRSRQRKARGRDTNDKPVARDIVVNRLLNKGSFGVVYQAFRHSTGEIVALKKVRIDPTRRDREAQALDSFDHENIISLVGQYFTQDWEEQEVTYNNLVFALMDVDLAVLLQMNKELKRQMSVSVIRWYIRQASLALQHVHERGWCHRDIKPANFLLTLSQNKLKLCDFGSAKRLVDGEHNTAYIMSRFYRAPELLLGSTQYGTSIDVWGLGCVTVELLLGTPLFEGKSTADQLLRIMRRLGTPSTADVASMGVGVSADQLPSVRESSTSLTELLELLGSEAVMAVPLLDSIFVYDPSTRPTAAAMLHDSFLQVDPPSLEPPLELGITTAQEAAPPPSPRPPPFAIVSGELIMQNLVASGSFADVYQGLITETNQRVAVKVLELPRKHKSRELALLNLMDHPNIIRLKVAFKRSSNDVSKRISIAQSLKDSVESVDHDFLYIVSDLMPTTLAAEILALRTERLVLSPNTARVYMQQALDALRYIHRLGWIHRDIKPANILVDPCSLLLKICDFGAAKKLEPAKASVHYIGARPYRSPEMLTGLGVYDQSIDVWAMACVFIEILRGKPAFRSSSAIRQLSLIVCWLGYPDAAQRAAINAELNDEVWNMVPKPTTELKREQFVRAVQNTALTDLIFGMMQYAPKLRLSAERALQSPFFSDDAV